jgi:hypothetical protein
MTIIFERIAKGCKILLDKNKTLEEHQYLLATVFGAPTRFDYFLVGRRNIDPSTKICEIIYTH